MEVRRRFLCAVLMLLYLTLILENTLRYKGNSIEKCKACSVCLSLKLDARSYPGRNDLRRKACVKTNGLTKGLLLSDKMNSMLRLTNLSMCAWFLILLSGDIQMNPGPTRSVKDPCPVCSKGCRTKAILCDSCDSWYHTKCIGMQMSEYEALGKLSARWECIRCLFPNTFADQSIGETIGNIACEAEGQEYVFPKLKRGLKIAHLNVNRLYNKLDSVKELLQQTSLDVFGLSETWLTSDIDDDELGFEGYSIFREDRGTKGR